jgi:hypothetical protein
MAYGGVAGLAAGGMPKHPRYLEGPTDGMADKLDTTIDDKEPAKLSHGEFVIPADVVSHLGNGNSKAGANVLYQMMDRVRMARTGTKKQGKRINPGKFTPGGIAGYAEGGDVKRFAGEGGSSVTTGSGDTKLTAPFPVSTSSQSNLSAWAGPYITDYLGKGQALANMQYTPYMGQLTAGTSPLQQQAYQGLGSINPNATFDTQAAQQYMSPYLQASLNPQLAEIQRQSDIGQQGIQAKFAQAGAFGGARDAIARAEGQRNADMLKSQVIGQGYNTAFNTAMQQYNTAQQQRLANLGAIAGAGTQQQQTEQQALDAQKAQFEQQMMWPYKQLQFQQSLIQGLPTGTQTNTQQLSPIQQAAGAVGGLSSIYDTLGKIFK